VVEAVRCGGDTDTVAAVLGGIVGGAVGKKGIPQTMISDLYEWPMTPGWIETLGKRLSEVVSGGKAQRAPGVSFFGSLMRNLFFLVLVMTHGCRRLLPPY
jgi:hypothetical protein